MEIELQLTDENQFVADIAELSGVFNQHRDDPPRLLAAHVMEVMAKQGTVLLHADRPEWLQPGVSKRISVNIPVVSG